MIITIPIVIVIRARITSTSTAVMSVITAVFVLVELMTIANVTISI